VDVESRHELNALMDFFVSLYEETALKAFTNSNNSMAARPLTQSHFAASYASKTHLVAAFLAL